jgi:hypothetical protein
LTNLDALRIAQCLELSVAETPKNEDLLIAACHFWSNGVNAFLFGHGPMSPTLILFAPDVSDRYSNLRAAWDSLVEAANRGHPRAFQVAVTVVLEQLKREQQPKK